MRHLIFIRHGESEHSVQGLMGGWTDSSLTDKGLHQTTATAKYLAKLTLPNTTSLYSSDLPRAVATAEIISKQISITPVALSALREINTGAAAGLSLAEAARLNAREPAVPDLDWRPNPTAETYREMALRIKSVVDEIDQATPETAVIVGHGLSGQEVLRSWLRLPLHDEARVAFRLHHASFSEAQINRWDERELTHLNLTFV